MVRRLAAGAYEWEAIRPAILERFGGWNALWPDATSGNHRSIYGRYYSTMRRERRSSGTAERRQTHGPAARSVAFDAHRLGRRIGPAWLTISQLCSRWQLDRKTIYKFIDAEILPAWRVGERLYRVAVEDVVRFEAMNKLSAALSNRRLSLRRDD
jgi:excisionase family DNA binding protein